MDKKKSKERYNSKKINGAFETLPIVHDDTREPLTNMAIPSDDDVEEAKDWVDYNKL